MSTQKVNFIVVHCSDSPQGRGDDASNIHQWHSEKGWDGIGYHYVIDEKGVVENGRPVFEQGRSFWMGAHVSGHNHESIGICLIGKDEFNESQFSALERLICSLKVTWPKATVCGHADLDSSKSCPNFNVKAWWNEV